MNSYTGIKDKYVGLLVGGCVGDVLGSQNENLSFKAIRAQGVDGIKTTFPNGARYTDDTELTIVLSRHLIDRQLDVDTNGVHQEYSDTIKTSKRGYSARTRGIFNAYNRFTLPGSAATNGAIMRISPLALVHHVSDADLRRKIRAAVYCTHGESKDATDACFVYVKLLKLLMYNSSVAITTVLKLLLEECTKIKNTKLFSLMKLVSLTYTIDSDDVDVTKLLFGCDMFQINAIDCFVCAMYCFARSYNDPLKAVTAAANMGGDTDTIAKLVGELVGAKHGTGWIPRELQQHEGKDELVKLAIDIWFLKTNPRQV